MKKEQRTLESLDASYTRLVRDCLCGSENSAFDEPTLCAVDALLERVRKLPSPAREHAFVYGALKIGNIRKKQNQSLRPAA